MPNVNRDPNCQTRYEGQDGYALVDRARYEALEAECERLRKAMEAIRRHQEVVVGHDMPGLSAIWRIADAALAENERLRAELALLWRDPARECAGCGSIPAGKAAFWCGECVAALRADAGRAGLYLKALEAIDDMLAVHPWKRKTNPETHAAWMRWRIELRAAVAAAREAT